MLLGMRRRIRGYKKESLHSNSSFIFYSQIKPSSRTRKIALNV